MRKSKYLILNSFYFEFNDGLTYIIRKELLRKQNILDLERFNKCTEIPDRFAYLNLNFIYLPVNVISIEFVSFSNNQIQILDLSNRKYLIELGICSFQCNQIKCLRLPQNIEIIKEGTFLENQIQSLNLSNYKKLKYIEKDSFSYNQIKQLKLSINIIKIEENSFKHNQIEKLDLSIYIKLKKIYKHAFSENPLNEIKILDNVLLEYDEYFYFLKDPWNTFTKYYNDNKMKSGDYKYNNNEWKWYPL